MPLSTPTQITVPWATSGLKTAIPAAADPVLGRAGYDAGFPAINMTAKTAGGIPPFGQDFNGALFDITTAIQYLEAGGSFPYSSAFSTAVGGYPLGAIVSRTDGTGLWRNTVANNTTNPETGGAGWQPEDAGSMAVVMTSSNVTLTSLQASKTILVIAGALTTSLNLILPAYVKQWLVVNNGTGAFTVTVKTAAGSGIAISTGVTQAVYGDGTNINAGSMQPQQMAAVVGGVRNAKMSVTAASATATFTADEVAVKTALSGSAWMLPNFNKTINLATTGAGGMDTGSAPASGFVGLYAIYNPATGTSALLAANATAAAILEIYGGANMPSGYTASALVSIWATDGSGLLQTGSQLDRSVGFLPRLLLTSTAVPATPTSFSATLIPRNAKTVGGSLSVTSTLASSMQLRITSTVGRDYEKYLSSNVAAGEGKATPFANLPVVTAQTLYYVATNSAGTSTVGATMSEYTF